MRITHVNFAKGFRGGERQTLNLIQALVRPGIQQSLICRTGSELALRAAMPGLDIIESSHPLLGHFGVPQSNLMHVHEARGAYWAAIEYALRKTPYLITRRIPNPVSASRVTRAVYRHAATLIGVSLDVSSRLAAQTGRRVDTIFDSCSLSAPDPQQAAAIRTQLGGTPIIGHVGALQDHHKGQSILIEAFHRLCATYPDARLLLVGEGPDRARFEALAKNDRRIVFAGFQNDVGAWIAAMDVFAFPSREEGLGSSVLDAMALGIPVVGSAVGGLPELIGRQQRGLLVDSHDPQQWALAIAQVLEEATPRTQRVEEAKIFARQNDMAAMAERYLQVYRSLLMRE